MHISSVARMALPAMASIGKTILENPVVSTVAFGILTSPYWTQAAQAGAGAYMACIDTCAQGIHHWSRAIVCPTICAPFLLAPGG